MHSDSSNSILGVRLVMFIGVMALLFGCSDSPTKHVNTAPAFQALAPQSVMEGQELSTDCYATDADGDSLILTVENIPANAVFTDHGDGTGTLVFMPDYTQAGTYEVRSVVSDGALADTMVVTITVMEAGNQAPILAFIGAQTVSEGENLSFVVSAADPDLDSLILSAENVPLNAEFTDRFDGTGTFEFSPDFTQAGEYSVRFLATDGSLIDTGFVEVSVLEAGDPPTPPTIISEPEDVTVNNSLPATFRVIAEGSPPLTYQWMRDGVEIPGAIESHYTLQYTRTSDSGSTFAVIVSNTVDTVTSRLAKLNVRTTYGICGFRPLFEPDPWDLIGVRYKFLVKANGGGFHIIFQYNRLIGPGPLITYDFEANLYSNRLEYTDGGCTTWPLLGLDRAGETSLRLATPDWPFHTGEQPGITTGILTSDPMNYPIQTYLIDNIPNLYKSDAISQFDATGLEALVTIERGPTITDLAAFARCGRPLESGIYRQWSATIEMEGLPTAVVTIVAPDDRARNFAPWEALYFETEYLHTKGEFTAQYWDFAIIRESEPTWQPVTRFLCSSRYDGHGEDFGTRVVNVNGHNRVEISNVAGNTYIPIGASFAY